VAYNVGSWHIEYSLCCGLAMAYGSI